MGQVKIVKGDLFQYQGHKAHGVNTKGAMGAGVAKIFKKKYPEMYQSYREECFQKRLLPGGCFAAKENGEFVFNLAIKDHWKDPADVEWVKESVATLIGQMKYMGIKEIAMPWIGCGLGGLNKDDVRDILAVAVDWEEDITILVYEQ